MIPLGMTIALVVASILAFMGGTIGGVFAGLWWQSQKTAKVWEKAYNHVREQLPMVYVHTPAPASLARDPHTWGDIAPNHTAPPVPKPVHRVQAATTPHHHVDAMITETERTVTLDYDDDEEGKVDAPTNYRRPKSTLDR